MLTIRPLLEIRGAQLHSLEIVAPIPMLGVDFGPLDDVMDWAPNLRYLKISVEFITEQMFAMCEDVELHHKSLKRLYLHCFDPTQRGDLGAAHVATGVFFGKFTGLKILGVHERLGWRDNVSSIGALEEIHALLRMQAEEEASAADVPVEAAGLYFYGTR